MPYDKNSISNGGDEEPNQASPPVNQGLPLKAVRWSTAARVSIADRNQEVIDAKCRCWAMGCEEQATRYTLLCNEHEARNLNRSLAPVFGYPSPEAIEVARQIVKSHVFHKDRDITNSWVDLFWKALRSHAASEEIGKDGELLTRPALRAPRFLKSFFVRGGKRRTEGKWMVVELLAFTLAVDALVLPHVSWPMKRYHLQPMLANVLLGSRNRQVTFKNLGPTWAALNEGRDFTTVRTRRSDLKFIGDRILKSLLPYFLEAGGRESSGWMDVQNKFLTAYWSKYPERMDTREGKPVVLKWNT